MPPAPEVSIGTAPSGGVFTDDHGVGDRDDLVDGKLSASGVLMDRLGARRLIDADRADRAGALVEDIAADPADVLGHLLVADLGRAGGRLLEVATRFPATAAQDRVLIHLIPSGSLHGNIADGTTTGPGCQELRSPATRCTR